MTEARRTAGQANAIAMVATAFAPEDDRDAERTGVFAGYAKALLPEYDGRPDSSNEETLAFLRTWIESLPETFARYLVPLAAIAAQAVVDLAHELEQSPEQVLSDIAASLWDEADPEDDGDV